MGRDVMAEAEAVGMPSKLQRQRLREKRSEKLERSATDAASKKLSGEERRAQDQAAAAAADALLKQLDSEAAAVDAKRKAKAKKKSAWRLHWLFSQLKGSGQRCCGKRASYRVLFAAVLDAPLPLIMVAKTACVCHRVRGTRNPLAHHHCAAGKAKAAGAAAHDNGTAAAVGSAASPAAAQPSSQKAADGAGAAARASHAMHAMPDAHANGSAMTAADHSGRRDGTDSTAGSAADAALQRARRRQEGYTPTGVLQAPANAQQRVRDLEGSMGRASLNGSQASLDSGGGHGPSRSPGDAAAGDGAARHPVADEPIGETPEQAAAAREAAAKQVRLCRFSSMQQIMRCLVYRPSARSPAAVCCSVQSHGCHASDGVMPSRWQALLRNEAVTCLHAAPSAYNHV